MMGFSRLRMLIAFLAALASAAAAYGLCKESSWAIYAAVAVGYTAGICCLVWNSASAWGWADWLRVAMLHTLHVAVVVSLVRMELHGGAMLPRWLTNSYVFISRTGVPRTTTLLNQAANLAIVMLIYIESTWILRKERDSSSPSTNDL